MTTETLISRALDNLLVLTTNQALEGKWHLPTCCERYDVQGLGEHLMDTLARSECAARRQAWSEQAFGAASPSWEQLPAAAYVMTELWTDPQTWVGDVGFYGRTQSAQFVGDVTIMELVVHAWDLARAIGQDVAVDDALVATALAAARQIDEMGGRRYGSFGPELPVATDAPPLDKLLAFTGRDAHWAT
jgi:uncharacterized protein (TIGR03086 family)